MSFEIGVLVVTGGLGGTTELLRRGYFGFVGYDVRLLVLIGSVVLA